MEALSQKSTQAQQQQELTKIVVPAAKATHLFTLANLSVEALAFLADVSKKPGAEQKLLSKKEMIKMFL